jgi:hypothetical protein
MNQDSPLCDEIPEYLVYHGLEGGRAVGETKIHDQWPKETCLVWNAACYLLPSRIWTLLYPQHTLSLVKYHAPLS